MRLPTPHDARTALRGAVSLAGRVALPTEAGVRLERRLRGWEEAHRLRAADGVVVSFGKSGRTWFRVLLSRYFAQKFGLPAGSLMEFDEFHRARAELPVLFFTHDNYLKDYAGHGRKFELYGDKRVILLVRDPRDTAVSQYFQWKLRMMPRKKVINGYPDGDVALFDFVIGEQSGLPKVIGFMNDWAHDLARFSDLLVISYEDLKADTAGQLGHALRFLGEDPTGAELADAASFASVENMRRMEQENAGKLAANVRLKPGDATDPSSFKVRRAKVGGWRDYMTDEQAAAINAMVRERLDPVFGYGA